MGTDVVVRDHSREMTTLSNEQLKYIAHTEFVPKGLRGNLPAILACVATGRAIGIDDMSAIRSIHIIDGKATFSAELMVMLVRRRGHSITGDVSGESATVTGTRADNGDTMSVTWTLEMAKRAGLAGKSNWKSYPESMLWARAVSQLCRMLFADCFAGSTYTTEELGEEHTDSAGEPTATPGSGGTADPVPAEVAASAPTGVGEQAAPADGGAGGVSEAAAAPPYDPLFPPQDWPEPGPLTDREPKMAKKLNVMVAKLRGAGHITAEQLWRGMQLDPELGRGEDGEIHWSPLRDRLTRAQAMELIDRLTNLEERVKAPAFEIPKSARGAA